MNRYLAFLATAAVLLAAGMAFAAPRHSTGQIRRIDKEGGKITIRHGAIANLQLPPMTLVFHVADPEMLERVQPGDTAQFRAEKINGQYTITSLIN